MSAELTPRQLGMVTPETGEGLPVDPRIVSFGSFGSAGDVEAGLREELAAKGLDVTVVQARLVTAIDTHFYGRYSVDPASAPAIEAPQPPAKAGRLASLGNLLLRRQAVAPVEAPPAVLPDSLPMGVVIFPDMRQRTPDGATASTVPTPRDKIIALCEAHGVPYVVAQHLGEARAGIDGLFQQPALPDAIMGE